MDKSTLKSQPEFVGRLFSQDGPTIAEGRAVAALALGVKRSSLSLEQMDQRERERQRAN